MNPDAPVINIFIVSALSTKAYMTRFHAAARVACVRHDIVHAPQRGEVGFACAADQSCYTAHGNNSSMRGFGLKKGGAGAQPSATPCDRIQPDSLGIESPGK
jgi:hypothetical protein